MKLRSKLYAAALFAAAALSAAYVFYTAPGSGAGAPNYWITVDAAEMQHIGSLAGATAVEQHDGILIVRADETTLADLSGKMHDEFHKCAGFMRHSSLEEARETIAGFKAAEAGKQFVDYTINNSAAVVPMLAVAEEPRIRQTIIDLSALHTRRHDQQGGLDGANMILSRWRALAQGRSDMSVMPYAHFNASGAFLTPQPSIILTIQGTEFPDETVVVGGHQDSINSSGGATGNAPGADDDASGIASITEAIRVIKETGFRPKRTIQFIAYAAEEVGLVGSKNIADAYRAQNRNIIGVMQLDMTNFKGPSADIAIITDFTNAAQNQFVRDLVSTYQPNLVVLDSACGYACSDHASWHNNQYPASMPFEAKYPAEYNTQIHRTTDTIDRSNNNANHALKFSKLAISYVAELAKGSITPVAGPRDTGFDYDGDGKADISVFRPADSIWHLNQSTAGYYATRFGLPADRVTPADYDGDGKADIAVYRDGIWHLLRSTEGYTSMQWGLPEDILQPGDYDGDSRADLAVFRPSSGTWYIARSTGGHTIFQFGLNGDKPVAADFDGDGKTDAAVYRNGVWHILGSTSGYSVFQFGIATDRPVNADFDNDGKSDAAVYRDGVWYVLNSTGGVVVFQWGLPADKPAPADYDGDGKADLAVYREGVWYIFNSASSSVRIEQFGLAGDTPTPYAFVN